MPARRESSNGRLDHPGPSVRCSARLCGGGLSGDLAPTFGANRDQPEKLRSGRSKRPTSTGGWSPFPGRLRPVTSSSAGTLHRSDGVEPYGAASFEKSARSTASRCSPQGGGRRFHFGGDVDVPCGHARRRPRSKGRGSPSSSPSQLRRAGAPVMGANLLPVLITLEAMGADAVGLNCSTGPAAMEGAQFKTFCRTPPSPHLCKPNAGKPCADDPTGYDLTPEAFALGDKRLLDAGAALWAAAAAPRPNTSAALAGCAIRALRPRCPKSRRTITPPRLRDGAFFLEPTMSTHRTIEWL